MSRPVNGVAASNVANPLSNFTKVKKLGEGGFGKVYLVQDHRDGQQYVMKEIDLSKLDAKGRRESIKECAFLARMAHPNIISYKEWFEVAGPPPNAAGPWGPQAWKGGPPPQGGKNSSTLYICMSYADGGDLEARIKVQQKLSATGRFHPFPEQQIIDWFIQTALAIKHIHDRKILHRDIKSQNIFLTKLNLVKLGDFGIARDLSSTMAKAMTQIGTPFYLSPEIASEKPYDAKSDIWALGIVLYELMALKHPFGGQTMKQLISNIVTATYPPPPNIYSRPLMDLVAFLLQKNPKNRPSINQLLRFPFIQQHIGRFLSNHKIQEEFSHTILHGQLGGAAGGPGGKAPMLPSKEQAQVRAQQMHAAQEAEARREAQRGAQQQQQMQQQQMQQQQLQQQQQQIAAAARAEAAARDQARQQAIARAKALAVEQAERARREHALALRQQQERQRDQLERQREQREIEIRQRMQQARQRDAQREQQVREQQVREQRDLQARKDEANRKEAQRRADERAREANDRKEREREVWRDQRDQHAAAAGARASPARPSARGQAKASPSRPPWVGIDEGAAAKDAELERAHQQEMEDRRREEERRVEENMRRREHEEREKERARERRRQEEEWELEQRRKERNRASPTQEPSSIAATMVRPMQRQQQPTSQPQQQQQQPRQEYHDPRDGPRPSQQQQQQHQQQPSRHVLHRAASAAELPDRSHGGGSESRSEKAAKQRAHEEQLAQARKQYFEERKQLEARQKGLLQGPPSGQRASPPAGQRDDDRYTPRGGRDEPSVRQSAQQQHHRAESTPSGGKPTPTAAEHEALLAQARKEYYDERKALEAKQKAMQAGGGAPLRDSRGEGESVPSAAQPSSAKSSNNNHGGKPTAAEHEAQLARARKEYYDERKALEAKQKAMMRDGPAAAGGAPAGDTPDEAKLERNERPLDGGGGGGGGGMKRAASEAVFDRPPSSAGVKRGAPPAAEAVAAAEKKQPPAATRKSIEAKPIVREQPTVVAPSVSDAQQQQPADDDVQYRRGAAYGKAKVAAMAEKEAELARLRVEYFAERQALAARKAQVIADAQAEKAGTAVAAATPAPSQARTPMTDVPASAGGGPLSGRKEKFAVQHALASLPGSPCSADGDGGSPPVYAAGASSSSAVLPEAEPEGSTTETETARAAEASIEELARDTNSCEQMVQLMQTMRDIMLPAGAQKGRPQPNGRSGEGEADDVDDDDDDDAAGFDDDDDAEYIPPILADPSHSGGAAYNANANPPLVADEDEDDSPGEGNTLPGEDDLEDTDNDEAEDEAESAPATEAEASAVNEFSEFQADELRETVASALAKSAELDLAQLQLGERRRRDNDDGLSEDAHLAEPRDTAEDDVGELPSVVQPSSRAGATTAAAASATPGAGTSSLYNASATLPPNRIPIVSTTSSMSLPPSTATASSAAHAASSSSSYSSPSSSSSSHPPPPPFQSNPSASPEFPSHGGHGGDSSFLASSDPSQGGGDPLSYKVESLRLFLSEKLGDDLLLDIYRLLRRSMKGGVQSVHTVYSSGSGSGSGSGSEATSLQSSPATTMQQPASGRLANGAPSSRRGSLSSLVMNNISIRDLLQGSGLLTGATTKYTSLIQQLIKAEHQLYGQL